MITTVGLMGLISCTRSDQQQHQPPPANEIVYNESTLSAGSFTLGAIVGDKSAFAVESPTSTVTIGSPLTMGTSEVTQGLWIQITGQNPSKYTRCGTDCPVESVSFCDVVLFCQCAFNRQRLSTGLQCSESDALWFRTPAMQCLGQRDHAHVVK